MFPAYLEYACEQRVKNVFLKERRNIVSNEKKDERMFKLWSMICKMIMDGRRDPKKVAEVLRSMICKMIMEKRDPQKVAEIFETLSGVITAVNVYERLCFLWHISYVMVESGLFDPQKVADMFQTIVDEPVKIVKNYLNRLFTVKLGATDGTGNYEKAAEVFKAGLDPDFKNWGIIFSGVAPEMDIAIDELTENGEFSEFLGDTAEELEKRHILGAQLVKFCQDHPDWLCKNGCATFFILTKDDEPVKEDLSNVFIGCIKLDTHGWLHGCVYLFSYDDKWRTGRDHWHHQVIYPIYPSGHNAKR
jgi:urease gamma subunit